MISTGCSAWCARLARADSERSARWVRRSACRAASTDTAASTAISSSSGQLMSAKNSPAIVPARASPATHSAMIRRRPRRDTTYQPLVTQISRPAATIRMASRCSAMPIRLNPMAAIRETSAPTADTRSPAVGRSATSAAARRATVPFAAVRAVRAICVVEAIRAVRAIRAGRPRPVCRRVIGHPHPRYEIVGPRAAPDVPQ